MTKHDRVIDDLSSGRESKMKVFGNSMLPIIKSGSVVTFKAFDKYSIGDIVFCKVRGRLIDAHKVTSISNRGYMISNNKGHDNGWTHTIYGKAITWLN